MYKVINWVMCKNLKFDYTNKWYMHNPAAVMENEHINTYGTFTYKRIT